MLHLNSVLFLHFNCLRRHLKSHKTFLVHVFILSIHIETFDASICTESLFCFSHFLMLVIILNDGPNDIPSIHI